jgi:hypothetical protein
VRIITIYQTEPDWCALVELSSGAKATLTFARQPSEAEVEALAAALDMPPETTLELEAEDGTVI